VLFYSTYGHVYRLAQAIADGAREVPGVDVVLKRVPETLSAEAIKSMGATEAQKAFASVPIATVATWWTLVQSFSARRRGSGTWRAQMRQFLDGTGGLWAQGKLVGKVGSVFVSSATQHGGQESTILSFPYDAASPRDGDCGTAVCVPGSDAP